MRYRKLGQSDIQASVVAFGAWAIGGWLWGGAEEQEAISAIHAAIDGGINFIDTAPMYGMGQSEELVGKAIQGRRDKVILATKCGLVWDGTGQGIYKFSTTETTIANDGPIKVYQYLGSKSIRQELEASLKRLNTDYIDLYQTHWQDNSTPIEETMGTLMDLKREGKIRAIGCSNATTAQMDLYRTAGQLDTDQELYSMLDRNHEQNNLAYCADHHVAFLAYSPLAHGLLTGKIGPERQFGQGDLRQYQARFHEKNRMRIAKMLDKFKPLTEQYQCTLSQLVIAWTLAQPGCSHVLVGARNLQQVQENLKGGNIVISEEDNHFIRQCIETYNAEGGL